jgi:hypothetical protein
MRSLGYGEKQCYFHVQFWGESHIGRRMEFTPYRIPEGRDGANIGQNLEGCIFQER